MKKRYILLVEDNSDDEELTLMALRQSNIANEVVVVHDGVEAVEYLFGSNKSPGLGVNDLPQVILLDLKMPRLGGLDVLRRIRSDLRTQMLPVVILTSSSEEEDILSSYRLGANSYVRKPIEFRRFAEAVQQLGLYWLIVNQTPPLR
ncbi:response regulator [Levilinea saccharolytica]|uniref:Chemotaxis protein CheY n=1 Tax=Levilinea saccharolytica TaxID=229921 RepID=A0A0N8GN91_9CHLR|nr:response regulator [Levilinea saccharolytica]KPL77442.1 chemotaxis protein CheY [Levilinea saccharolytica]GAP18805.1 response regulator consisting of a CheY-like receiver domain and a winged-helix DNA-binding domain [Levilinea saccharolytica]